MSNQTAMRTPAKWNFEPIEGVKCVIAVASGKGGVGKSTTTVNLAHALTASGQTVGILDADIYGPSIPRMMNLSGQPQIKDGALTPLENHNIKCMSMGFIAPTDGAVVWRGPMITKALTQMLRSVDWKGEKGLDTLLVDMPPGTGDIHLSIAQQVPLAGAIIVTTPQDIATIDAKKCADMFSKVKVPILGVIENMSYFEDPETHNKSYIFGQGGGKKLAEEINAPFLGEIPINITIREASDAGNAPDVNTLKTYSEILNRLNKN